MTGEVRKHSQDPAEGSRRMIEHELQDQELNNRESGARKLEERPGEAGPRGTDQDAGQGATDGR